MSTRTLLGVAVVLVMATVVCGAGTGSVKSDLVPCTIANWSMPGMVTVADRDRERTRDRIRDCADRDRDRARDRIRDCADRDRDRARDRIRDCCDKDRDRDRKRDGSCQE